MSNGLKSIAPGKLPLASDVGQLVGALSGSNDVGTLTFVPPQTQPPAPNVTNTGSTGNLNGAYTWVVVIVTGWQQTDKSWWVSGFAPSLESASVTITSQSANVALPIGSTGTIARAIYRTAAGGASGTEKFVGIVWDNSTVTFVDNVADANLGAGMPTTSSNPAAYGNAIPANVPVGNTTGTKLNGYGNVYTLANILNEQYNFNGSLQGSRAGWASFSRSSFASNPNLPLQAYAYNVPRYAPSKFGNGIWIEEGTTNLVENSDFETVTTTAQVFSDALTSYTGSTVPKPWTLSSGIGFSFSASGAVSSSGFSRMVAGNAQWKPVLGSDGTTKLSLTAQATFTEGAALGNAVVYLFVDVNNMYMAQLTSTTFYIYKLSGGTQTQLASLAYTPTTATAYTISLSLDNTGLLTAHLKTGGADVSGSPLTHIDSTPLAGGFQIGIGCDTNVTATSASVTAPWANGWTIGGDSRVAWALNSTSPISGSYSVSAVGVGATIQGFTYQTPTLTASVAYTVSGYISTNNEGTTHGAWLELDCGSFNLHNTGIVGTIPTTRYTISGTNGTSTNATLYLVQKDTGTVTFDAIQLEQKAYATSYLQNNSTTGSWTRAAETLTLPATLLNASQGAIAVWAYEDGNNHQAYLFDTYNHQFMIEKNGGVYKVYWNGANIGTTPPMASIGLHLYVLKWNGTAVTLYIDSVAQMTTTAPAPLSLAGVVSIYIGSSNASGAQWNNVISGLMFFNTAITDAQVADLYALTQPAQDAFGSALGGMMTVNDVNTRSGCYAWNTSSSQTLSAGVWTKLTFNSVAEDNLSEFSTSTSTFTSINGGRYIMESGIEGSLVAGASVFLGAYVNGSEHARIGNQWNFGTASNYVMVSGSTELLLNPGDQVTLYAEASGTFQTYDYSQTTWMRMRKIA